MVAVNPVNTVVAAEPLFPTLNVLRIGEDVC